MADAAHWSAPTVTAKTKAGTPTDADVGGAAFAKDGMIIADTTASKVWIRVGGVWKGVAIA